MRTEDLLAYTVNGNFLDKEIHHIIRTGFFEKMLMENCLFLRKATDWDDPYDAALLKMDTLLDDKIVPLSDSIKEIYGQCWTDRADECDGLWRVYSNNRTNDVVRITVKIRSLLEAVLNSPAHDYRFKDFAIGKVLYETNEELRSKLVFRPCGLQNAVEWGEAFLFHKRKEFSYESEVRLIYKALDSKDQKENGIYKIPMPYAWSEIIERVQFSPWMCSCKKEQLRKLFSEYNFRPENVVDSTLYEIPQAPIPVEPYKKEAADWAQFSTQESRKYTEIMEAAGNTPENLSIIDESELDECICPRESNHQSTPSNGNQQPPLT